MTLKKSFLLKYNLSDNGTQTWDAIVSSDISKMLNSKRYLESCDQSDQADYRQQNLHDFTITFRMSRVPW